MRIADLDGFPLSPRSLRYFVFSPPSVSGGAPSQSELMPQAAFDPASSSRGSAAPMSGKALPFRYVIYKSLGGSASEIRRRLLIVLAYGRLFFERGFGGSGG